MGSYIHAKYINDNKVLVKGMICLEMLGYYSDKPNSQNYPVQFLSWFYGDKADYIMLVQRYWNGKFGYSAVMITNTSFYRNKNYHENTDKFETLDVKRLALTVDELYLTLKQYK